MKKLAIIFVLLTGVFRMNAQNTSLIKDISAGPNGSLSCNDEIAGNFGDKVLLIVREAPSYTWPDLYVSDGTESGTMMIHDGGEDDWVQQFVQISESKMAYVMFNNLDQTFKLYTTDGNTSELVTAHDNSTIYNLKSIGNDLTYNNATAIKKVNLSNASEELLINVAPRTMMDYYFDGPHVLYYAVRPSNNSQDDTLYVRDLSTSVVTNLGPISKSSSSLAQYNLNFTKLGSKIILFNWGQDESYMYASDGAPSSTVLLKKFYSIDQTLCYIKVVENERLYFDGVAVESNSTLQEEFFVSDGTVSGTFSLSSEETKFSNVSCAVAFDGKIYFKAQDYIDYKGRVFVTDGTIAGTVLTPYQSEVLDGIIVQDDLLFVTSYTGVNGEAGTTEGIWVFNQEEGLNMFNDFYKLFEDSESFYQCNLYATPSKLFFTGSNATIGSEPFLFIPSERVVTASSTQVSHENLFSYYPNPADDQLILEYKGTDEILIMKLRDMSGRVISTYESTHSSIDMSSLGQGVYCLEVELKNSKQVLKIIRK